MGTATEDGAFERTHLRRVRNEPPAAPIPQRRASSDGGSDKPAAWQAQESTGTSKATSARRNRGRPTSRRHPGLSLTRLVAPCIQILHTQSSVRMWPAHLCDPAMTPRCGHTNVEIFQVKVNPVKIVLVREGCAVAAIQARVKRIRFFISTPDRHHHNGASRMGVLQGIQLF